MYIAVAGNICAGKTTLVHLLSQHYGWMTDYERVDENPYLSDFCKDMERWSFHLQMHVLQKKIARLFYFQNNHQDFIQDRSIYEDVFIFSEHFYTTNLMSEREYNTYLAFFRVLESFFPPPDLLIYLKASTSILKKRMIGTEICRDYLQILNTRYEYYFHHYKRGKMLVIDIEKNSFLNDPEDFLKIIRQIDHFLPEKKVLLP